MVVSTSRPVDSVCLILLSDFGLIAVVPVSYACEYGSIVGKLHLTLCADVLHQSTSNRHINNLIKILPKELLGRKHLILLADNGPDWGMGYANILSFGRLWKALGIDRLTVLHYSPHHSRFNFVERRWGL